MKLEKEIRNENKYVVLNGDKIKISDLSPEARKKLGIRCDYNEKANEHQVEKMRIELAREKKEKVERKNISELKYQYHKKSDSGLDIVAKMIGREMGRMWAWLRSTNR